ncbi:MAG: hypothetical protein H6730_24670 [Deltaproteobacteria bacterium]|nr:hypothetical protein [Deltaproteobacteria bacterium]
MDPTIEIWLYRLFFALVGAFGTALIHEKTGREVSTGGWFGLLIGAFLGPYYLVSFWVWLFYRQPRLRVQVVNRRRRWYTWWR